MFVHRHRRRTPLRDGKPLPDWQGPSGPGFRPVPGRLNQPPPLGAVRFGTRSMNEINRGMRELVAQNFLVSRTELKEARSQFDHTLTSAKPRHRTLEAWICRKLDRERFRWDTPRPHQRRDQPPREPLDRCDLQDLHGPKSKRPPGQ